MEKIYQEHSDYDRKYRSKEFSCLNYYSKKMMKRRHPGKKYTVVGAVGEGVNDEAQEFLFRENYHSFYGLKYSRGRYGIDGYLDCGNNEYMAVIRDKRLKRLLLSLFLLLVLAGLMVGGYLIMNDRISLDPNTENYTPKIELPENADPNSIAIPGYDELTMLAGTDEMYAALWNPETNPCYFKFTIELEDGNKKIYESELVSPGKAITTVKLNQKMKKGSYPVLIKMDTFSLEDGKTPMNGGTSKAVLNVVEE